MIREQVTIQDYELYINKSSIDFLMISDSKLD
jgi:hypothetical protein